MEQRNLALPAIEKHDTILLIGNSCKGTTTVAQAIKKQLQEKKQKVKIISVDRFMKKENSHDYHLVYQAHKYGCKEDTVLNHGNIARVLGTKIFARLKKVHNTPYTHIIQCSLERGCLNFLKHLEGFKDVVFSVNLQYSEETVKGHLGIQNPSSHRLPFSEYITAEFNYIDENITIDKQQPAEIASTIINTYNTKTKYVLSQSNNTNMIKSLCTKSFNQGNKNSSSSSNSSDSDSDW